MCRNKSKFDCVLSFLSISMPLATNGAGDNRDYWRRTGDLAATGVIVVLP